MDTCTLNTTQRALCAMASRRQRAIRPVHRYGFDSDDPDSASDDVDSVDDIEWNGDPNADTDSESGTSSASETDHSDDDAGWSFVTSNDAGMVHVDFTGDGGWRQNHQPESMDEYLTTFLPDGLFEDICKWTNSRALIGEAEAFENDPHCGFKFKPVELKEMKTFFGITLATGVIKKPSIDSYWSTEPLLSTPYFRQCMSRDRYKGILKYLRFSDPYQVDPAKRNTRIEGIDKTCFEINKCYVPQDSLSLDETLLLHKGRLSFRMFIKSKRARFGVKIYFLCDSQGYMVCSEVYYGAGTVLECAEPGYDNLSKSEQVVVALLSKAGFLRKGYIVTLDNWYTSLRLCNYLWEQRTPMRGTIRRNRGIPTVLKSKQLISRFDVAYVRKGPILCVKYKDRKDVYVISTADAAGEIERETVLRGGERITYKKPVAIHHYNLEMGGVDITDQYLSGLNICRKSQVWFKKVGITYLQRMVLNAFLRFRLERNPKMSFLQFTKYAICHLTGMDSEPERGRHKRASNALEVPGHFPEEISAGIQPRKRRKCAQCLKGGERKDSYYFCPRCPGNPALCVTPCFRLFHSDGQ